MRSISPFLTPFKETTPSSPKPKPGPKPKSVNQYLTHLPCSKQGLATKAGLSLAGARYVLAKMVKDGLAEPWGQECSERGKILQLYIPTQK